LHQPPNPTLNNEKEGVIRIGTVSGNLLLLV
jgi:hypothetical protein